MVKTLLVSQIVADGAMLLRELDRQNFAVETMFWIDVPEHHYWQLVIASPRVGTEGSAAIYRKLGDIIRSIGVSGFSLADAWNLGRYTEYQARFCQSVAQTGTSPELPGAAMVSNIGLVTWSQQ